MTTLTQPLEISVLSAPLAAIDRRALSQAWYSALGYSTEAVRVARCVHPAGSERSRTRGARHGVTVARAAPPPSLRLIHGKKATNATARRVPEVERASGEPRRKACAPRLAQPGSPVKLARTTVTLGGAGGRVHLVVQDRGGALAVIAICRPEVRRRVARALSEACTLLARRGVVVEARLKGRASCT
jgi:hypothetical protein